MPKKGQRSQKGVGDLYNEPKLRVNLALTESAKDLLDSRAAELGISRSEVVEQFARAKVGLPGDLTKEDKHQLGEA